MLLFAKVAEVPFTHNRAERDLRMSNVKQTVSGCFRTERYAKAYCRISSYIQTMTAKDYNPMATIEMAMSGEIYNSTVRAVTNFLYIGDIPVFNYSFQQPVKMILQTLAKWHGIDFGW